MIVLGIETSTPQTTVAVGHEQGIIASSLLSTGKSHHEVVIPAIERMFRWSGIEIGSVAGVAVGIGPGLFTGLRVGVETGKALAQVLQIPIVGLASLDVLAFAVRYSRRMIAGVIDARRGEVFFGFYRPVPGGVTRASEFMVGSPDRLMAELEARGEEVLLVGNGAILYRKQLEHLASQVEFASAAHAHPNAAALVELSIPRFHREEFDRVFELGPLYLRKSDAEIAWDKRARTG